MQGSLASTAEEEAVLIKQLEALEAEAQEREAELNQRITSQQHVLEVTRAEAQELSSLSETQAELKEKAHQLKSQLIQAKAFGLHKQLSQTIRDSREQTSRLRKIIDHVKEEKDKVDAEFASVAAERDELRKVSVLRCLCPSHSHNLCS